MSARNVHAEVWQKTIEQNFFSSWDFLTRISKDDSMYADFRFVHIPNAGTGLSDMLLKNNTSFPVTHEEREDTIRTYSIDSYMMPPIRLARFDNKDLTYDKMSSVVQDQIGNISERIKWDAYYNWYIGKEPGKYVETSGENSGATSAPGSDAIVHTISEADVKKAAAILDKQNCPVSGRYLLLPTDMFYQLHDSILDRFTINDNDGMLMLDKPFYGFNVVADTRVLILEDDGTAKEFGAVTGATDIEAGYAFHSSAVSIAKKEVMVDVLRGVGMYGDTVEAETWAGSAYRRNDKNFIVPIIQKIVE